MSGTHKAGRSGFPEPPAQAHAGLPLRELLAILRRRQRMILFVVVLLTGIATLIGLQTTKTYTATALVMIQPQQEHVVDVEQVAQGLSGDGAAIETQVKFVQSHENLARTVDKLGLHADSRLVGGDQESGGIVGAIAGLLPSKWLIAAGSAQDPGLEPGLDELRERAIGALRGGLKVEQSGWSYILAVNYTAPDARAAARLANGIADAYVDGQLEHKLSATRRANTWLAERVEELRLRVLESERSAEEYRAAHELAGSDSLSFDAQQIAGLTAQLIDARAERTAKQAKLRRVQELRGERDPDGVMTADALPSPLIVSLRQQELDLSREEALLSGEYGERHPRIQQLQAEKRRIADRIGQEIENAIRNLEGEIAVAGSREEAIGASLREARGDSAITGQAAVQLRELEREAAANRGLYENFLVRWKETEQQEQIVRSDARVISPAQAPGAPSSPSPKLFAFVGFTASVVCASILALVLEHLDSRLRSTRQVEELLRVPALGVVPEVKEIEGSLRRYLSDKPGSACAESLRALYAGLRLSNVDAPPQVLLVTSALPAEGKTSLAAGLAVSASQLRQKTILLDLDLRRPAVGREFDLRSDAGIVEVIAGDVFLEDAVQRDEQSGVDVLGVARGHSNPALLLTSERLELLLEDLRAQYDCVVIDAPPVLGVVDAKALARVVDAVVFVIRWERTTKDAARAALKELDDVSANLGGAVLNHVDMKRHASYGYGDAGQYYLQYSRYYQN